MVLTTDLEMWIRCPTPVMYEVRIVDTETGQIRTLIETKINSCPNDEKKAYLKLFKNTKFLIHEIKIKKL